MITKASAVANLLKFLPDPIEFSAFSITPTPVPPELKAILGKNLEDFSKFGVVALRFSNLSGSTMKDIRINLPNKLHYSPYLISNGLKNRLEHEWNEEKLELIIKKLDPSGTVFIYLYPDIEEFDSFNEKNTDVFISDKKIFGLQKFLGHIKSTPKRFKIHPVSTSMEFLSLAFLIGIIIFTGSLLYNNYYKSLDPNSESAKIERAMNRLGSTCSPKLVPMTLAVLNDVENSIIPLKFVLFMNRVNSKDELSKMDEIVICVQR
jgi:hypothetical protein